jgi:hypothetical protein
VIPGDSDKLVFYFQGGGACWNEESTKAHFCSTNIHPQPSNMGLFDRSNDKNYFRSHTIVNVLYCSGDVHGGNSVRPYNDRNGVPVKQVGLLNANATLNWVKQQMSSGFLSSKLEELVVMGCSAGSLGSQLWSKTLLSSLSWKRAAIVPDSYAGIFPDGTIGPLVYDFGFCSSGFLSPELTTKCYAQEITMEEIALENMNSFPTIPFSYIQSKTDIFQRVFYVLVAATTNSTPIFPTPAGFYDKVNGLFATYNSKAANFLTYLVDHDEHCFTPINLYYDATTKGPKDKGRKTDTEALHEWVNHMPLKESDSLNSRCDGETQTTAVGLVSEKKRDDNTYCSSNVVPKQFTEHY